LPANDRRLRMSYEEFLAWADEDTRAEWVDGEVIISMPPKLIHQELMLFLGGLLNRYARKLRLGKAVVAPFEMIISSVEASRQPDIFFVRREHLDPRPRRHRVEYYLLDAEGKYLPVLPDAQGRYRSTVLPGFWLDPAWLWQDPLPDDVDLVEEMLAQRQAVPPDN
jgi:Uma2 family endonuclease